MEERTVDSGDEQREEELRDTVEDRCDARQGEAERIDIDDWAGYQRELTTPRRVPTVVCDDRQDKNDHQELREPDLGMLLQCRSDQSTKLFRHVLGVPIGDCRVIHRCVHNGRTERHHKNQRLEQQ
jgi:hypothetical protein